jgi:hypothetical protein
MPRLHGYRLIVRRDGAAVRLYTRNAFELNTRNAFELTARLSAIAAAAERIKATTSRSTARRWCRGLTARHDSMNCADGGLRKPRSSVIVEHDLEEVRAGRRSWSAIPPA